MKKTIVHKNIKISITDTFIINNLPNVYRTTLNSNVCEYIY